MAESLGTAVLDLTTNDAMLRSGLARGERDTKSSFGRMSTGVIKSAAGIATAFGAYKLGKALFVDPIQMAGNFQQTLKVLQAVTHTSGSEMQMLSAKAIKLGADVKLPATSAQDAADAMLQLGKAGFSTGQIMSSVHSVLLLSAAAEISNADSADMVTKAIGAFGLKAKDTAMIVDDFAGAANQSQSSIQDVGFAMTMAGAAFKSVNVPIGDASTAIALLAKHGITGSMAGSALNQAFLRLGNPTTKMTDTMKHLGVNLFDANGKFVGMRSAIEQLSPKLAGMTDQQRLHTLAVLGGSRASKAMQFVFGASIKQWDAMKKAVERAGQAQQIANAKTAGFNGAMSGLKSTLETLQITLGTRVLPKATEFVKFLERIAGAKSFSIAIKIVWQGVVNVAEDLKAAIQKALFGGSELQLKTGSLRLGQQKIVVDPGLVAKLQDAVNTMIATTDWSALGARIADGLGKSSAAIEKGMSTAMNAMMTWVSAHQGQIADVGLTIGLTMVSKLLDPSFWIAHWQLIGGIALSAAAVMFPEGRLAKIGVDALGFLLKPFELLGVRLAELGTKAVIALEDSVSSRLSSSFAGRAAAAIASAIGAIVTKAVSLMVDLGDKMVTGFINKIAGLGIIFRTAAFTAIVTVIGGLVGAAVSAAVKVADGIVTGIRSFAGKLTLQTLLIAAVLGPLGVILGPARGKAEEVAQGIAGGIKTAAAKLEGLGGDLIGKMTGAIQSAAAAAYTKATQIGASLAAGVLDGISSLAGDLASKLSGAVGSAVGFVKGKFGIHSPSQVFADELGAPMAAGIIKGLTDGIDNLVPAATTSIRKLAAAIATETKKNASAVAGAFGQWASEAKKQFDAQADGIMKSLDAQLKVAQMKVDSFKAKLTPTEVLQAQLQAQAALASVKSSYEQAKTILENLKAKQDATWAQLLADQAKNMAALQAGAQATATTAFIAEHEVNKDAAASANDPVAMALLTAHQALDAVTALFNQGQATQQQLLDAQDAFDAAALAAADDANATKLDSDYVTWQGLVAQQAAAQQQIVEAQAQNAADQAAMQAQFATDAQAAQDAFGAAKQGLLDYYIDQEAKHERAHTDAQATELNTELVARYNRIKTHLDNVVKATNANYDELARAATKSGGVIGSNLAQAMRDAIPLVDSAAKALAQTVSRYLKTNSPSEAGPMSTLDTWWKGFAPTLIKGLDQKLITTAISGAVNPRLNTGMMTPYATDAQVGAAITGGHGGVTLNQTFHETPASADPVAIGAVTSFALKNLRT